MLSYTVCCTAHGALTDVELHSLLHYTRGTNSLAAEHKILKLPTPNAVTALDCDLHITTSQPHHFLRHHLKNGSPSISSLITAAARNVPANEGFLLDKAGNAHPPPPHSTSYHPFHRLHHQISRLFIPATSRTALP